MNSPLPLKPRPNISTISSQNQSFGRPQQNEFVQQQTIAGNVTANKAQKNHNHVVASEPESIQISTSFPDPWSNSQQAPWIYRLRPLSDIREATEPSLSEVIHRPDWIQVNQKPKESQISLIRQCSAASSDTRDRIPRKAVPQGPQIPQIKQFPPRNNLVDHDSSAYSVSLENVPNRSPTKNKSKRKEKDRVREKSPSMMRRDQIYQKNPQRESRLGYILPKSVVSNSPVKELIDNFLGTRSDNRLTTSRTLVRTHEPNIDVLDFPNHNHPRINCELHLAATTFVGGGSLEGHIRVVIPEVERARHKRQLAISRISIDLLGVEEITGPKRNVFLNLTTELIDSINLPPSTMVESLKQMGPMDPFWLINPSVSNMPFCLKLPLDVGPTPFQSRHARIRYVLGVTSLIRDQGKQYLIRTSQDVSVISVYDPEKALVSLPSPLTVSDEYFRHRDLPNDGIKVTAGLYRQVWVSGACIFVDVQITNTMNKSIKRLELQLERDILCYKHAAASTSERNRNQSRIFDFNERSILTKKALKVSSSGSWPGVSGMSSDTRTFDLDLPRGEATIKCGKYFEARYFLNVIVGTATKTKLVTLQLPVVLIHMNSLDVVPNSVAQVAAAIEEKQIKHMARSKSNKSHRRNRLNSNGHKRETSNTSSIAVQGRAFAAPRKQSQDRITFIRGDTKPSLMSTKSPLKPNSPIYHHKVKRSSAKRTRRTGATSSTNNLPSAIEPPPRFKIPARIASRDQLDYTYQSPSDLSSVQAGHRFHHSYIPRPPPKVPQHKPSLSIVQRIRRIKSEETASQLSMRPALGSKANEHEAQVAKRKPVMLPTNEEPLNAGPNGATGTGFRRMKSIEKWRGGVMGALLGGSHGAGNRREKDRGRERDERERLDTEHDQVKTFGNWI